MFNNNSGSAFVWITVLVAGFMTIAIWCIFYDASMPMIEYSHEVNPTDPSRDFYEEAVWDLFPLWILIIGIFTVIANSQHREE